MNAAKAVISVLGDLLLLITLIYVIRALNTANGARSDAQASDLAASQARQEAARLKIEAAERDHQWAQEAGLLRRRDRVIEVSQVVETLFWNIDPYAHASDDLAKHLWMPDRNSLQHMLLGLREKLPSCANIIDAGTAVARCAGRVRACARVFPGAVEGRHGLEAPR